MGMRLAVVFGLFLVEVLVVRSCAPEWRKGYELRSSGGGWPLFCMGSIKNILWIGARWYFVPVKVEVTGLLRFVDGVRVIASIKKGDRYFFFSCMISDGKVDDWLMACARMNVIGT